MSQSLFISRTVNMGKFVWGCTLCLHETKRKSNIIRHIKLVHGINVVKKKDAGMNTEDSATKETKNFCCNMCLYNTVKKYNLMRHVKRIHSRKESRQHEEERYLTREEFAEIMSRLKTHLQSPSTDDDNSKLVIDIFVEKFEVKIREGFLKALEILTG